MIVNKEKRIKYLGFNDFWFTLIGILLLSIVTDYLFNDSFAKAPPVEAIINWSISLFFTICNWFFMRSVMIYLRIRFPQNRQIPTRIFLVILFIIVSITVIDYLGNMFLHSFAESYNPLKRSRILLPILIISIMVQAIYEAIYFYVKLKRSIQEEEQAKRMIVQVQLDALRNQAQPHFLFNTLNTLRDIIDQNSKEEAKNFVDKIAEVYRFILLSGDANTIPLSDELKFCKAYMHIQNERFGANLMVKWSIPDERLKDMIVPMSLQLLLENAIKHNVVSSKYPLVINVDIKDDDLVVQNSIQAKTSQLPSTKMGLLNIQKRYKLISERVPIIVHNPKEFKVSVPIFNKSDKIHFHANSNN